MSSIEKVRNFSGTRFKSLLPWTSRGARTGGDFGGGVSKRKAAVFVRGQYNRTAFFLALWINALLLKTGLPSFKGRSRYFHFDTCQTKQTWS
ncbi:MAG: hypothetical protein ABSA13_15150 [Beijerinckiaceae bacterium]|jgi:hypothetical protein